MCGTLQTSITSQLLICSCPPNQNTWLYIERSSYCLCIMWLVLSCVTIREGTGRRKWKNKSRYSHSYGEVIFIRKNRNFLAPKSQRILPKNTCPFPHTHTIKNACICPTIKEGKEIIPWAGYSNYLPLHSAHLHSTAERAAEFRTVSTGKYGSHLT